MPVVIDTEYCCGCRACVLACSYYHTKTFGIKSGTSIDIRRWPKEGKFGIVLYRQAEDGHPACDCPEGDELCLKYCSDTGHDELKAILKGEISSGKEKTEW